MENPKKEKGFKIRFCSCLIEKGKKDRKETPPFYFLWQAKVEDGQKVVFSCICSKIVVVASVHNGDLMADKQCNIVQWWMGSQKKGDEEKREIVERRTSTKQRLIGKTGMKEGRRMVVGVIHGGGQTEGNGHESVDHS